jgi:cytochrome c oxidase cbb3-type subunit 3
MTRLPVLCLLILIAACGRPADDPADGASKTQLTAAFDRVYGENCAGCHGANGRNGAALSLNDSVYRTVMDSAAVQRAVATGVPGTLMPAFAHSAGGTLADSEIAVIVTGIRERWGKSMAATPGTPVYAAPPGNPVAGADAYATFCAGCHGNPGDTASRSGAIADPSYLALVSNQWLRTVTIVGRPERGMPDWRGYVPGRPMTNTEIADVVAWLAAQRVPFAGQPYLSRR